MKIKYSGDASNSEAALCYQGGDGTVLKLDSGEMGGGKIIDGATISDSENAAKSLRCAASSEINRTVSIAKLRLGMSKDDVMKQWSEPGKAMPDGSWYYSFSAAKQIRQTEFMEGVIFDLRFTNDKLVRIRVTKTTSN